MQMSYIIQTQRGNDASKSTWGGVVGGTGGLGVVGGSRGLAIGLSQSYDTKYLLLLNWLLLACKILNKTKNMFAIYCLFLNSLLSYTRSHYLFFFFPLKFAFYPQIPSLPLCRYAQRKLYKNDLSTDCSYVKFTGKMNQTCPFYR